MHHQWDWVLIERRAAETFALIRGDGLPVAAWACFKKTLSSPDGFFYRFEYVEIDPDFLGGDLGIFTVALACGRALELGCAGLVLPCLDETAEHFHDIGAAWHLIRGWSVAAGLVPFKICSTLAKELLGSSDEYRTP